MKKYIIAALIISMLMLCACGTDKTVVNVNVQKAKMTFQESNSIDISKIPKEYHVDKEGAFETYIKSEIKSKSFNVLGVEYCDIEYYQSEKNKYTGEDRDVYSNKDVQIKTSPNGDIYSFFTYTPIKVFANESKHSEELAKKYLELLYPEYKYDSITLNKNEQLGLYSYRFIKNINGVRTTERIGITLNSNGELCDYYIKDLGKYDNIEIEGVDTNELTKRIDGYISDAYGDMVMDKGIAEEGPCYHIYVDNKIELYFSFWIKVKEPDGFEHTITEVVVFELN